MARKACASLLCLAALAVTPGGSRAEEAGEAAAGPPPSRPPPAVVSQVFSQFQLPPSTPEIGAPPRPFVQQLEFQYAYGSESDATFRRDADLDKRVRDDLLLLAPQINGIVVYRPNSWLELTGEAILEKEIAVDEEPRVALPNGQIQEARKRRLSLLVDQAYVAVKNVTAPFEFSFGRKNYEDDRHTLFDSSLDIGSIGFRQGAFRAEATAGREIAADLDLAPRRRQQRDRIDTFMLYGEYRGIEDLKLAAYTINRHDRDPGREGFGRLMGVRALGNPSDALNYWVDLGWLRGRDEQARKFVGYGYDVGFTYRFTKVGFHPAVTLGYAFGSGDATPNDGRNSQFRQSGLQSNEVRMAGVSKFKTYGEALDPELSNIKIFTLGYGIRPAPNLYVDFVYHRYRTDEPAQELRNSPLTAEMNQIEGAQSRDVGKGFDVVLGFRRVFGQPRLGIDVRIGRFFPGRAFQRNDGNDEVPVLRDADNALMVVMKFWW